MLVDASDITASPHFLTEVLRRSECSTNPQGSQATSLTTSSPERNRSLTILTVHQDGGDIASGYSSLPVRVFARAGSGQEKGGFVSSIIFKACRRCAGELYLEEDTDGEYLSCIRCGYVTYPQNELKRTAMFLEEPSAIAGVAVEGS